MIQDYRRGPSGGCTASPRVRLALDTDPAVPGEAVLLVDYSEPTSDPASRDVRCEALTRDWTTGRAIAVRVKPSHTERLSFSFIDRNGVVYTTWRTLQEGVWQTIRIAFDDLRPNPYFQPPGARLGAPLDVSDVPFIAFAPQGQTSGRLAINRFVVVQ